MLVFGDGFFKLRGVQRGLRADAEGYHATSADRVRERVQGLPRKGRGPEKELTWEPVQYSCFHKRLHRTEQAKSLVLLRKFDGATTVDEVIADMVQEWFDGRM